MRRQQRLHRPGLRPPVRHGVGVRLTAAVLAVLAVVATVAAAADQAAIGRLNHAGVSQRRHCTVFAVAPRVALTAAHCLAGVAPDEITVLFGYARMTWAAEGRPARAVDLGADVAAVCLRDDAPAHLDPVALSADVLGAGTTATVVGYGIPRAHLQTETTCRVLAAGAGEALLDCTVRAGASGAPVRSGASGAPVLDAAGRPFGVVSRAGADRAVAALIPPDAAAACD